MVGPRAGRYVAQVSGYRAFMPAPLPPEPPIDLEGSLRNLLSRADRMLGRLDGAIQTLPAAELFVLMYVRKEAVLSSQIEGTQSSLHDVLDAEARIFRPDRPDDVHEVINYVGAMQHGLERLRDLPLSVRLIREIHERLLRDVRGGRHQPGELRRSQNWIGPAGCTLREANFVPPPPDDVPALSWATWSFSSTVRTISRRLSGSDLPTRSSKPFTPFSTGTAGSDGFSSPFCSASRRS